VIWEDRRLRRAGQVNMIRAALEGFGKSLKATDAIVVKAAGNTMALVHRYSPFVARGVIAHPLQDGGAPRPRTKESARWGDGRALHTSEGSRLRGDQPGVRSRAPLR
jgi:hypothetical protein